MSRHTTEREVLERVVAELEAEGYEVYLYPNRHLLPPFLAGYTPDAVALGPGKSLAVEVLKKSDQATRRRKRIQALFEGQDKWELRVMDSAHKRERGPASPDVGDHQAAHRRSEGACRPGSSRTLLTPRMGDI
jgi:REase_AHJR-like